ncbi:hypothetical protein ACE939_01565 [Aquimarina sp. W85]|uniref:hypothetical protein n=1 Tax=Aquimarina rhodophyticola TaxID=3342246 RepID=UPI00366AD53F
MKNTESSTISQEVLDTSSKVGDQRNEESPEGLESPSTNKKIFIWFSGTSSKAKKAKEVLQIASLEKQGVEVLILDGVGTNKMTNSEENYWIHTKKSVFSPVIRPVINLKRLITGYRESTHISQHDQIIKFIDQIESNSENKGKKFDLLIGGHSRGAAVGLKSYLANLETQLDRLENNENNKNSKSIFMNLGKLDFMVVDPVAGEMKNDYMSGQHKSLIETSINDIIDNIKTSLQEINKNKNLKVTGISYNARYDKRKAFKLDEDWKPFFKSKDKNYQKEVFVAGFSHSSMVSLKKSILYEENESPRDLLVKIIKQRLGFVSLEETKELARKLDKIEYDLVFNLREGKDLKSSKMKELKKITCHFDYKKILHCIGVQSLSGIVLKTKETDITYNNRKPLERRSSRINKNPPKRSV